MYTLLSLLFFPGKFSSVIFPCPSHRGSVTVLLVFPHLGFSVVVVPVHPSGSSRVLVTLAEPAWVHLLIAAGSMNRVSSG